MYHTVEFVPLKRELQLGRVDLRLGVMAREAIRLPLHWKAYSEGLFGRPIRKAYSEGLFATASSFRRCTAEVDRSNM